MTKRFAPLWEKLPEPLPPKSVRILVVDGTTVVRHMIVALIARDALGGVVSWAFVPRESFAAWTDFLGNLRRGGVVPDLIVCDAQKGLLLAIKAVWPEAKVQRCQAHVIRLARSWLTRHPKTAAGAELLFLVRRLPVVKDRDEQDRWISDLKEWCGTHHSFLKERSVSPETGRRWYTHRKLRAVRSLLLNAAPQLFTFLEVSGAPRTTNHVEGGVNARLKELLRSHRGLPPKKRVALAAWFLRARQKPTREFY